MKPPRVRNSMVLRVLPSGPGTYILVFRCRAARRIDVGRLGRMALRPGYYLYVGSAFGPGGLRARVMRHCRMEKPRRWHIDYLRPSVETIEVWFSQNPERMEHSWADLLARDGLLTTPLHGFGSGDCRCRSHLFFSSLRPRIGRFRSRIAGQFPGHPPVCRWPARDEGFSCPSWSG